VFSLLRHSLCPRGTEEPRRTVIGSAGWRGGFCAGRASRSGCRDPVRSDGGAIGGTADAHGAADGELLGGAGCAPGAELRLRSDGHGVGGAVSRVDGPRRPVLGGDLADDSRGVAGPGRCARRGGAGVVGVVLAGLLDPPEHAVTPMATEAPITPITTVVPIRRRFQPAALFIGNSL
jgi:hypothetical protein